MKHSILVTGAMGFVGGRVAQALAFNGNKVILGSRRMHAPPEWLPTADVVEMDWMSKESLTSACKDVDVIVHLAAMNDSECFRDPVGALEVNGVNTVRLIEASKNSNVSRFVYISTAHVYGSPLSGCIDEDTLPRSRHPYATSHRAAEDAVLADSDKITSIVVRLSNGFGRPMHAGVNSWMLLVNDLCRQAITDGSITLRSSGLQRRDFVTLHDVGRAICHMAYLPEIKVGNGIFNLGGGRSIQVMEMAKIIQSRCTKLLGFTPEIIRSTVSSNEECLDFEYKIDKLLATGFSLNGSICDEIDGILKMCIGTWGHSKIK